jgi:hypothetical protein
MKTFYSEATQTVSTSLVGGATLHPAAASVSAPSTALIAVYEAPGSAPRVEQIDPAPVAEFIEAIATRVHQLTGEAGGNLPYTVVREVAENLIHAGFAEPVISILDGGSTVRFADQGPGIPEKDRAVLPGYTTAHGGMKAFIRGVGSGFPIVRDFLSVSGGDLVIEDNLGCGSVVTISCSPSSPPTAPHELGHIPVDGPVDQVQVSHLKDSGPARPPRPRLTTRQTQVLALVLESGSAGPSLVAGELSVGLSTAYRDLAYLEELGLMEADGGKRTVTQDGLRFLDEIAAR